MGWSSLFDLTDDVVVVTGGASGLGAALADGCAAFGATVVVMDRDAGAADKIASSLDGGRGLAVTCDVSREEEVGAAITQVRDALGRLDVLIACAGIGDRAPAEYQTTAQWDRVLAVNLRGLWLCDQAAGQIMIKDGVAGRIVNMASVAGLVGLTNGNVNYSASKGGVIALTRCLAAEWARYGIRVNALAPTHFRTPLVARAIAENPAFERYYLGNIPLGRLGEAADIVGPGVFLASRASAMVTGHVLVVDGGHTAV